MICLLLALATAAWLAGPPGGYSEAELERLSDEILRAYARTPDGEPVITHIGLGRDGKQQHVVVGVIENHADEYSRLFLWKYGGRVHVVSEERFASPS